MTKITPEPGEHWGIFGGSFDPVHNGHLHLARELARYLKLKGVLWVLTDNHPIKKEQKNVGYYDRKQMLEIALTDYPQFVISEIEREEHLSGYTVDTIAALKRKYTGVQFSFLVGADILHELDHWKDPERIMTEVSLVAGCRPGSSFEVDKKYSITFVETDELDISSSEIRDAIKNEAFESVVEKLHPGVAEYIKQRNLYS